MITWGKVTRRKDILLFLQREESRSRNRTDVVCLQLAYTALPLGQTGSYCRQLPGCFSFYRDFGGLVVFCVLFGLCGGTCQNLLLVVIIDLLGLDNLGKALGLVMMVNSICLSLAHPLLGQSLSVCLRGLDNLSMVVNSICLSLAHSLLSQSLSVCLFVYLCVHGVWTTFARPIGLGLVMMVNSVCFSLAHPLLGQSLSVCLSTGSGQPRQGLWAHVHDGQFSVSPSPISYLASHCLPAHLSVCLSVFLRGLDNLSQARPLGMMVNSLCLSVIRPLPG